MEIEYEFLENRYNTANPHRLSADLTVWSIKGGFNMDRCRFNVDYVSGFFLLSWQEIPYNKFSLNLN